MVGNLVTPTHEPPAVTQGGEDEESEREEEVSDNQEQLDNHANEVTTAHRRYSQRSREIDPHPPGFRELTSRVDKFSGRMTLRYGCKTMWKRLETVVGMSTGV